MVNILIVGEDEKFFIDAISDIDGVKIHEVIDYKNVLSVCMEKNIDLVIFDISILEQTLIESMESVRDSDITIMSIAIIDIGEENHSDEFIVSGMQDVITKPIDQKLFKRKIINYINIINYKTKRLFDNAAKNLFTNEVYSRSFVFRTLSHASLVEMWDYLLNEEKRDVIGFVESIKVFYAFAEFQIKRENRTRVVLEENKEKIFLTIEGIEGIPKKVITNVISRNYPNGLYKIDVNKITFKLSKVCGDEDKECFIDNDEKQVLRAHFSHKVSATEYVESTPINVMDAIENLEEIEDKMDLCIIDYEERGEIVSLQELSACFKEYFDVIENLAEFSHLSFAIDKLANFLVSLDDDNLDEDKKKKLGIFLGTILQDLTEWRKTIFIEKCTDDIHYMDSSLLNSLLQVEIAVEDIEEDDEDELELF